MRARARSRRAAGCRSRVWYGLSRKRMTRKLVETMAASVAAISRLWHLALLAIHEEQPVREHEGRADDEDQPQRAGDDAAAGLDALDARLLAVEGLVEPFRVGGLLRRCSRVDRLERPEEGKRPRVERCGVPFLEQWPFHMRDRSAVADELAAELRRLAPRKELRSLELLDHVRRLLFGAAPRVVVARVGQEDDEAEQHREARREHAEDACGAISVREEASHRRAAPEGKKARHRDDDRGDDDRRGQKQVHRRRQSSSRSA